MPGTHRYQRRSLNRVLRWSQAKPPRKVPTPAMSERIEIHTPASYELRPCDRCRNALLKAPLEYHTTECSAAARLRCRNERRAHR
jgi:hypothetical protein